MDKPQLFQGLFEFVAEIIEMPDSDKNLCFEYFEAFSCPAKTILEKQGRVPRYQYFVASGILRNYYFDEFRNEVTTDLNNGPRFFTSYNNFVARKISQECIESVTECDLLRISRDNVDILFEKSVILKDFTIRLLERVFREERIRISEFQQMAAEERYIRFAKENPKLIKYVPLKHVASFLGMKPETLSRIRHKVTA